MKKIKIIRIPLDQLYEFESDEDKEMFCRMYAARHGYFYPPSHPTPTPDPSTQNKTNILWIDEAVSYLGLDRIGLKRPEKAIHRLINKGALNPRKISGRLAFDRAELDKVLLNGDSKRGRGRPRGR